MQVPSPKLKENTKTRQYVLNYYQHIQRWQKLENFYVHFLDKTLLSLPWPKKKISSREYQS